MQRRIVGILALVLLAVGGLALASPADDGMRQNVAASCLRIGMVLGVLWLALPEFSRPASRWVFFALLVTIIVIASRPKLAVAAAVFMVGVLLLRPRLKSLTGRGP